LFFYFLSAPLNAGAVTARAQGKATYINPLIPGPSSSTNQTEENTRIYLPAVASGFASLSSPDPLAGGGGIHAMRVEYADYASSRPEVSPWVEKMRAAGINLVVLAAGRTEWAYFKWAGHTSDWSSAVSDTDIDILAQDSTIYGQFAQVNAVIDVFAPSTIRAHPEKAAINVLGQPSPNVVSTAELVNGGFGLKILDMVGYIAANYPDVDSISITELCYRIDGYGPDDLALYAAATGRTDWPRQSNGQIDIDDPTIGTWRSALIGQFLARATAIAHAYGKQLYLDVGVNYDNLSLMSNNRGQNYLVMLQNVDKIVVWDYFGEDGYSPLISQNIAQFLTQFGLDRVILSIGLWGANGTTVSPADFDQALQASWAGGMPNIWICPGSMMSAAHWQVLDSLWGK
jgi:hypothetical protein